MGLFHCGEWGEVGLEGEVLNLTMGDDRPTNLLTTFASTEEKDTSSQDRKFNLNTVPSRVSRGLVHFCSFGLQFEAIFKLLLEMEV